MHLVVFCSPKMEMLGRELQSALASSVPYDSLEIFLKFDQLEERLCRPRPNNGIDVAIFLPDCQKSLRELTGISDLMDGVRILLILPHRRRTAIAEAYKLRPRFIGYKESIPEEIIAVLHKIDGYMNKEKKRRKGYRR